MILWRSWWLAICFALNPLSWGADILLLKSYQPGQAIQGWLMSEKLVGMRATWNGKNLISRGNQLIHAPQWFIQDLPPFALDGELWMGRGTFQSLMQVVRDQNPGVGWKAVTYQIFEVPHQPGGLLQRLAVLENYLKAHPIDHVKVIEQFPCQGEDHLNSQLQSIQALGGEGLVLRNPPYALRNRSFQQRA